MKVYTKFNDESNEFLAANAHLTRTNMSNVPSGG